MIILVVFLLIFRGITFFVLLNDEDVFFFSNGYARKGSIKVHLQQEEVLILKTTLRYFGVIYFR